MMCEVRRSAVSPACRELITLMQQIQFGCIEDLIVQGGDPVFSPSSQITEEIRLGAGDDVQNQHPRSCDFALKSPVIDMLTRFAEVNNGRIERLEIRHGLPHRMIIARTCREGVSA